MGTRIHTPAAAAGALQATAPAAAAAVPPTGSVVIGSVRHETLGFYPPVRGMRLHSLAAPAVFVCQCCGQQRETALVATTSEHAPICPSCFAQLARADEPATP